MKPCYSTPPLRSRGRPKKTGSAPAPYQDRAVIACDGTALTGNAVERANDLLKALKKAKRPARDSLAGVLYRRLMSEVIAACLIELSN